MTDFFKPAVSVTMKNNHSIYRAWEIPGLRDSDYYDGTGIKKTYDLSDTDLDFPPDNEAVPSLRTVKAGNGTTYNIMEKTIVRKPVVCPECDIQGVQGSAGEKYCKECGLVLNQGDVAHSYTDEAFGSDGQRLQRDAAAAGRYVGEE